MEYIIIALLGILIVLVIVSLFKISKNKNTNGNDQIYDFKQEQQATLYKTTSEIQTQSFKLKEELNKLFSDSTLKNTKELVDFKDKLFTSIDKNIDSINTKVEQRLTKGFESTQDIFTKVIEQLTVINTTQKKIEALSNDVISLNDLLSDKKIRGIFGETQLYHLLENVFGNNEELFIKQKKLSNKLIVDAVLVMPEDQGDIPIDSKFPLENYKRMMDKSLLETDRAQANRQFKIDVKKHIDDISKKYIIVGETSKYALMFIPSEAIFLEINANFEELILYAQKQNVWLTSPSTLIYMLTTLQIATKDLKRSKHIEKVIKEIEKLGEEFKRLDTRWNDVKRVNETLNNKVKDMDITTNKIIDKFEKTYGVSFDEEKEEEKNEI
ncbi:RmuC domain protein [Alteracholeplasma palmae J233]|uniref:RmuC domain protein n=1 Tax=Alteracholeplasma palmae (strain ATCC 49389 / J233) TaxID=1318466 RepID=U4KM27_ALTPJ|nr:DNA recombination protein RmuC [Alteracholeplasma palmae]CCV65013.1 RmuC domain protein [Alteracholeplasma palmae J233]